MPGSTVVGIGLRCTCLDRVFPLGPEGETGLEAIPPVRTVRARNWGRHVWSRGYRVSTVGLDEARIRRYVQWQEKKKREDEAMQQRLF